ncbi:MAG: hypothetical protein ABF289_03025 [Clostridiales bacterium]
MEFVFFISFFITLAIYIILILSFKSKINKVDLISILLGCFVLFTSIFCSIFSVYDFLKSFILDNPSIIKFKNNELSSGILAMRITSIFISINIFRCLKLKPVPFVTITQSSFYLLNIGLLWCLKENGIESIMSQLISWSIFFIMDDSRIIHKYAALLNNRIYKVDKLLLSFFDIIIIIFAIIVIISLKLFFIGIFYSIFLIIILFLNYSLMYLGAGIEETSLEEVNIVKNNNLCFLCKMDKVKPSFKIISNKKNLSIKKSN